MKRLFVGIADVHRTGNRPVCRVEPNIMETQDSKLSEVATYAQRYQLPILSAGDLFDTYRCGHDVVNSTMSILARTKLVACFGQHELPDHDIHEAHRSPLMTLLVQNNNSVVTCPAKYKYLHIEVASWKQPVPKVPIVHKNSIKVLVMHKTVYLNEKPFPDAKGNVRKLITMPKYQQYDVVLTGDNHQSFKYRRGNTLWVNCGCLYRTDASEKGYFPCFWVFYWSEKRNRVCAKPIPVSYVRTHVSKEHLEDAKNEKEWESQFAGCLTKIKGCRPSSFVKNVFRALENVKDKGVEKFASNFLEFDEKPTKGKR